MAPPIVTPIDIIKLVKDQLALKNAPKADTPAATPTRKYGNTYYVKGVGYQDWENEDGSYGGTINVSSKEEVANPRASGTTSTASTAKAAAPKEDSYGTPYAYKGRRVQDVKDPSGKVIDTIDTATGQSIRTPQTGAAGASSSFGQAAQPGMTAGFGDRSQPLTNIGAVSSNLFRDQQRLNFGRGANGLPADLPIYGGTDAAPEGSLQLTPGTGNTRNPMYQGTKDNVAYGWGFNTDHSMRDVGLKSSGNYGKDTQTGLNIANVANGPAQAFMANAANDPKGYFANWKKALAMFGDPNLDQVDPYDLAAQLSNATGGNVTVPEPAQVVGMSGRVYATLTDGLNNNGQLIPETINQGANGGMQVRTPQQPSNTLFGRAPLDKHIPTGEQGFGNRSMMGGPPPPLASGGNVAVADEGPSFQGISNADLAALYLSQGNLGGYLAALGNVQHNAQIAKENPTQRNYNNQNGANNQGGMYGGHSRILEEKLIGADPVVPITPSNFGYQWNVPHAAGGMDFNLGPEGTPPWVTLNPNPPSTPFDSYYGAGDYNTKYGKNQYPGIADPTNDPNQNPQYQLNQGNQLLLQLQQANLKAQQGDTVALNAAKNDPIDAARIANIQNSRDANAYKWQHIGRQPTMVDTVPGMDLGPGQFANLTPEWQKVAQQQAFAQVQRDQDIQAQQYAIQQKMLELENKNLLNPAPQAPVAPAADPAEQAANPTAQLLALLGGGKKHLAQGGTVNMASGGGSSRPFDPRMLEPVPNAQDFAAQIQALRPRQQFAAVA